MSDPSPFDNVSLPRPPVPPAQPAHPFGAMVPPVPPPPMGPLGWTPAPQVKRHRLAVAAMVCGIVGIPLFFVFGVLPILAVVFGLVSQSAIRRSNGSLTGLGMARAGWILGIIGVLGFGVFVWAAATDRLDTDESRSGVSRANPLKVEVGGCFNLPESAGLESELVSVIFETPCALPHQLEAYHLGNLAEDGEEFPGAEEAFNLAFDECLPVFEDYVGEPYDTSKLDVYAFVAQELNWKATEGGVTCFVIDANLDMLTGSLKDSG